ncbi:hypothetical protein E2562_016993 [Oryza meyeriana var. granulata]|uniref:Uncharacterized protein n=1 Tax=Oryza meyeriana var. granulata TaxID=110450 RepID=A0A6G1EAE3_9ORYZ|nr:hypothetical protein E2562_016993 [Oryza meyeriana var. granulata]
MQAVRNLVLRHLRLGCHRSAAARGGGGARPAVYWFAPHLREMSASAGQEGGTRDCSEAAIRARVVELVKKFDKIDADKKKTAIRHSFVTFMKNTLLAPMSSSTLVSLDR